MSKLYKFRVLIDYEKDVFRDIEIMSDQKFIDFHRSIQQAFGFDESQISSFYMSDDDWGKGQEISMMDMAGEQDAENTISMSETSIADLVTDLNQKLVYVSDFFLMWCFFVELVKISEIDSNETYPKIALAFGDAPDQYSKEPDLGLEEFETDEADETEPSDDIFDGFDDFNDYQ